MDLKNGLFKERREQVIDRLVVGDSDRNYVPAYHFHICSKKENIMGTCDLRISYIDNL